MNKIHSKIIEEFARDILIEEGLNDWSVRYLAGGGGHCDKIKKRLLLGDNASFGIVLHEVAHAIDKNPPTKDGHWGYHADLMHQLFDKMISTRFTDNRILAEELEKLITQHKDCIKNQEPEAICDCGADNFNQALDVVKNKFLGGE